MRIGIDLDNTIINYDSAFIAAAKACDVVLPIGSENKLDVRNAVLRLDNGELLWQKIQGQVYSRFIKTHACLYPGVKRFLLHCQLFGNEVIIISHKTLHGHFDNEKTLIRDIALEFLNENGLIGGVSPLVKKVLFGSTREEKIAKIVAVNPDWFIDDLPEVIEDLQLASRIKKVFFAQADMEGFIKKLPSKLNYLATDWQQIDYLIQGDWDNADIKSLCSGEFENPIKTIEKVSNGRNAGVYRVNDVAGSSFKLKLYPPDLQHDRLLSESLACSAINKHKTGFVPSLIKTSKSLNYAIYEWVDGDPLKDHNLADIKKSIDFLRMLDSLKISREFEGAPNASAACFSGEEIESQLRKRLEQFSVIKKKNSNLANFLDNQFSPAMERALLRAKESWPTDLLFSQRLDKERQTLSPSDFGFHNMLKKSDGSICFLDFEYFGWDDPLKLIVDVSFHPGMALNDEDLRCWVSGALSIYGVSSIKRLRAIWPLYALIWCLIILNEFRPQIMHRRLLANTFTPCELENFLSMQLKKARKHLVKIETNNFDNLLNLI
jgi:hypothetical protein